jgi:hypothetical protein
MLQSRSINEFGERMLNGKVNFLKTEGFTIGLRFVRPSWAME